MAIREISRREFQDYKNPGVNRIVVDYRADLIADCAGLPPPDESNVDSTCLCYQDFSFRALTPNGWVVA